MRAVLASVTNQVPVDAWILAGGSHLRETAVARYLGIGVIWLWGAYGPRQPPYVSRPVGAEGCLCMSD